MKICVIGAGSTRLPLMMASMAGSGCRIDEVTLFDIMPDRISALLPVGERLCAHVGNPPRFVVARTSEEAVEGCDALILTIRPGFEAQRARDERTCMDLGVIGQETTGPAGFAFATRTIPAVAGYCATAQRLAPGFLPVIFTNPAGMVTRAMLDLGFEKAVGICDSATVAAKKIAARSSLGFHEVDFEVSGLNHLSWTRHVTGPDGADLMASALADPRFIAEAVPWLDRPVSGLDGIPVEYLYYYMRAADARQAMLAEPLSRGEVLAAANIGLFHALRGVDPVLATLRYAVWLAERNGTYMSYALGHRPDVDEKTACDDPLEFLAGQIGGYAEIAMELLTSSGADRPRLMALNIRNGGSIPELPDSDVVETDCVVDRNGITPRSHDPMPAVQADLVSRVSEYERLAVRAVFQAMSGRNADAGRTAVQALSAHPLVPGHDMAQKLAGRLFGRDGLTVQDISDMCLTIPETSP